MQFAYFLNDTSLFGDTEDEIINAITEVESLIKVYKQKKEETKPDYNSIYAEFEKRKRDQKSEYKEALADLRNAFNKNIRDYRNLISRYRDLQYGDFSYEIAKYERKVGELQSDLASEEERYEEIYERNIEIISENQRQALSETDHSHYSKLLRKSEKMLIDLKNKRTKIRYRDKRLREAKEAEIAEENAQKLR